MKEKFESLMRDLERYSKEDSRSAGIPRISDRLKGYYEGTSQAYALCAKWIKGCLEGRAGRRKFTPFHCYYPLGEPTKHYQQMKLCKFPKWIKAYKLTHPGCKAVSVKVWYADT